MVFGVVANHGDSSTGARAYLTQQLNLRNRQNVSASKTFSSRLVSNLPSRKRTAPK